MPYIGNIVQDFSVNTAMLNTDSVTSIKVLDGTIVNADINASAAIAGTKINPNFGSQNIVTTGTLGSDNITVAGSQPRIRLNDSGQDPDYSILNEDGVFGIYDDTNSAHRFKVNTDGHVDVTGNLDVGAGLDVTGSVAVSGSTDGVLNLDTSDSRGAFVRFGQGGSFHNMVGCADGLITGFDKEDLGIRATDKIGFATNGDNIKMTILSGGNVGIGTTSPRSLLDLGIGTDASTISNTAADYQLGLHAAQSTGGDIGRNIAFISQTVGTVTAAINSVDEGGSDQTGLVFLTGNNSSIDERVRIDQNGNVGIGTTGPTVTLDIESSAPTIKLTDSDATGTPECEVSGAGGDLILSADKDGEKDTSMIKFQIDGNTDVSINHDGAILGSGLSTNNDSTRNVRGLVLKSTAGISFQNFGANGSKNWRIRPDDASAWGSLDISVGDTANDSTSWPSGTGDLVVSLRENRDVHVDNGNLVIGTSGKGIDFYNYGSGTGVTSNLLDDYETGTWTPALTSGFFSGETYTTQDGTYVKIGDHLTAWFYIRFNQMSTSGGEIRINSPFTMLTGTNHKGSGIVSYHNFSNSSASHTLAVYQKNSTENKFYAGTGTLFTATAHTVQNGKYLIGFFSCRTP